MKIQKLAGWFLIIVGIAMELLSLRACTYTVFIGVYPLLKMSILCISITTVISLTAIVTGVIVLIKTKK